MTSESDQCIRPSSSSPDIHQTCKPDKSDQIRRSVTFIQKQNCDVPAVDAIARSNENERRVDVCSDDLCVPESNTSSHLARMFYPSDFSTNTQRHAPAENTLHKILTSVKDLLSKSPPQDFNVVLSEISTDSIESSRTRDLHPATGLHVSPQKSSQLAGNTLSPGWDEMFDDDQEETDVPSRRDDQMDFNESVELFDDDEEFLRVSIPDIHTPEPKTSENTPEPQKNVAAGHPNTASSPKSPEQNSEVFNCSQDFFSVNFDLGLSFDSEEEEVMKENTNTPALNKPEAPVVSPSSRPADEVRMRCVQTPLICEKWSSAPMRPSASTPNHELLTAAHRRTPHTSTGYTECVLLLPVVNYSHDVRAVSQ